MIPSNICEKNRSRIRKGDTTLMRKKVIQSLSDRRDRPPAANLERSRLETKKKKSTSTIRNAEPPDYPYPPTEWTTKHILHRAQSSKLQTKEFEEDFQEKEEGIIEMNHRLLLENKRYEEERQQWIGRLEEENSYLVEILQSVSEMKDKLGEEMEKLEETTRTAAPNRYWAHVKAELHDSQLDDVAESLGDTLDSIWEGQLNQYKSIEERLSQIGVEMIPGRRRKPKLKLNE